jgi:hypothetical protein
MRRRASGRGRVRPMIDRSDAATGGRRAVESAGPGGAFRRAARPRGRSWTGIRALPPQHGEPGRLSPIPVREIQELHSCSSRPVQRAAPADTRPDPHHGAPSRACVAVDLQAQQRANGRRPVDRDVKPTGAGVFHDADVLAFLGCELEAIERQGAPDPESIMIAEVDPARMGALPPGRVRAGVPSRAPEAPEGGLGGRPALEAVRQGQRGLRKGGPAGASTMSRRRWREALARGGA